MQISIYSRSDAKSYTAEFTRVRTIGKRSIGWAKLTDKGYGLRFPILYCEDLPCKVLTVDDWQAPFTWQFEADGTPIEYDLADPEAVRDLLSTGSGQFVYAKPRHHLDSANPSDIPKPFAR